MTVEEAIDVFCEGFCVTRSFTHPYRTMRVGPLWLMHDDPPKRVDPRNDEFIAYGTDPAEVVRLIKERGPLRHFLCAMALPDEPREAVKTAFKSVGYRALGKQPLMLCDLASVSVMPGPLPVVRVETPEQAELVKRAAGRKQILPQHIGVDDAPLRLYFVEDQGKAIGFVRSITVGKASWVSNMWVAPEYRRQGLGRALMSTMLVDDRAHGIETSVLLASETGSKLYLNVGYELVAVLHLFHPRKS